GSRVQLHDRSHPGERSRLHHRREDEERRGRQRERRCDVRRVLDADSRRVGQGLEAERDPAGAGLRKQAPTADTTTLRLIFLLFMVSTVVVVAVVRLLPWWGSIALFAVLILAARSFLRWGLPRLLRLPFKAKGVVLRDAAVDVHSIERVKLPSPDASDEHFWIDVTITPRTPRGAFTLWEPGELRIVGHDARAGDPHAEESDFEIRSLEVLEED